MTITNLPAMACLIASLTIASTRVFAAPTSDNNDRSDGSDNSNNGDNSADSHTSSESTAEQADEMRARAEAAFEAGDLDEAFRQFESAHATAPHPSDLFNLGRISEEKGELEVALSYYEQFVRMPRLSLAQREAAAERIEVLRKVAPADEDDEPEPRRSSGDSTTDRPPDRSRPLILSGAGLLSVGALAAIGGGVGFGLIARRNSETLSQLESGENPSRLTLSETEELHAQGQNAEALQITFLAAGSALALVGAGLLVTGIIKRKKYDQMAAVPVAGPNYAGMSATWRF